MAVSVEACAAGYSESRFRKHRAPGEGWPSSPTPITLPLTSRLCVQKIPQRPKTALPAQDQLFQQKSLVDISH